MAGGFVIFAGSLAAIGYVIATLVIRAADQDMARTWASFNDDPRPAQLLNSRLVEGMAAARKDAGGAGAERATANKHIMSLTHDGRGYRP